MAGPSPARVRAFVRQNTRLGPVPDVADLRLHLGDDVMTLVQRTGAELGETDPALPYWAFAWGGGLALVRYLEEHPEVVAGKHVLDLASGSGLCAIAAMRRGAASVVAIDTDPFAAAAVALNARANDVRVTFVGSDVLDAEPPACDVILAGDICYEEIMARRMLAWLRMAAADGTRVLIGDPGRAYLPRDLERLADYRVRASREIETAPVRDAAVYTIPTPT